MAQNVKVKLNMSGLAKLMKSQGVQNLVDEQAEKVVKNAGEKHFEKRKRTPRVDSIAVVGASDDRGKQLVAQGTLRKAVHYVG